MDVNRTLIESPIFITICLSLAQPNGPWEECKGEREGEASKVSRGRERERERDTRREKESEQRKADTEQVNARTSHSLDSTHTHTDTHTQTNNRLWYKVGFPLIWEGDKVCFSYLVWCCSSSVASLAFESRIWAFLCAQCWRSSLQERESREIAVEVEKEREKRANRTEQVTFE